MENFSLPVILSPWIVTNNTSGAQSNRGDTRDVKVGRAMVMANPPSTYGKECAKDQSLFGNAITIGFT